MKKSMPKFARLRGGVVGLLGAAALVAACEAKMPTAAEVEGMDVAKLEKRAVEMSVLPANDTTVVYLVDRKPVERKAALEIPASDIATINIAKAENDRKKVMIITKKFAEAAKAEVLDAPRREVGFATMSAVPGDPLVVIDGARSSTAELKKINMKDIESVEVLKGAAAVEAFGEDAKRGVIKVSTKAVPK